MQLRSNFPVTSAHTITRRAQWRSLGVDPVDMTRPKVAIVNTSNDLAACFAHLDQIVTVVKEELCQLGMLPFEIRTTAPSDFITNAGKGGRYVLSARDLVVNDIEVMVEGAQLDAMLCLSSCDKTTPAHLMAAGRINVPTVVVPCGYQRSGLAEGGEADVEEVFLKAAQQTPSDVADTSLTELADNAILSPGVCSGLATANSMHMAAEALGMAVSGSAPVRALSDSMWESVRRSARALADLVERDVRPRDIITIGSVGNAVRAMLAIGGSINTVKHLQGVAAEADIDIDVWETYRLLGRQTPTLCSIRPNGSDLIEDLEDSGGAATILRELLPLLDSDQLTVDARTVAQNADAARPGDGTVIRDLSNPFSTDPSILVLRGTLAEGGAVVKRPIPDPGPHRFRGPAKVFHSREEGVVAVEEDKIQAGDVAIIRGIGVTGGPAMGMISAFIFSLDGRGLASEVAVVTDGQMSGLVNHGIGVGEVSPEAAAGGALGLVEDGDLIEIDLKEGRIDLLVDPEVLATRPPYNPKEQIDTSGYLDQYRATVQPLACGAILCPRTETDLSAGGVR